MMLMELLYAPDIDMKSVWEKWCSGIPGIRRVAELEKFGGRVIVDFQERLLGCLEASETKSTS